MKLDILGVCSTNKKITLYDYTDIVEYGEIFKWSLEIQCSKIPYKVYIDLANYLKTKRVDDELFIITPEILGLNSTDIIPDGVYYLTYKMNNHSSVIPFIMYQTVKTAVEQLMIDTNYDIKVDNYDIQYVGDTSTNNIEHVRMCVYLLDLLILTGLKKNDVLANDTIITLNRLLGIIKI